MDEELQAYAFERMKKLGWLPEDADPHAPDFDFTAALIEYQQFAMIAVTGQVDQATLDDLRRVRVCGLPDSFATGEIRRQPIAAWQWSGPMLPTVSDPDVRLAIQKAFNEWSRVCPIKGSETVQGQPLSLNVISTTQNPMGNRNGVLADCQLPGPLVQLMRLDATELWNTGIDLFLTVLHELGHFWGLGHINTPNSVMNPYLNANLHELQPGDIAAMQQLYPGAPAIPPGTPTPVPPTPTPETFKYYQTLFDGLTKKPIKTFGLTELPTIVR